nr:hypothetical protein GCM10020063_021960 [Dactylosporangium thailandense]
MKHIAVVLSAAIVLTALAGCGVEIPSTPGQARPVSAAPSRPPKEVLADSLQVLDRTAYNFAIKQGDKSGGGRVDPGAHAAFLEQSGDVALPDGSTIHVSVAYTIVAPDFYIQADFGERINQHYGMVPGTWMKIDQKKITGTAIPIDEAGNPEPGIGELLATLGDVQRPDKTRLAGTVDLTGVEGIMAPSEQAVKNAGAKASSVPFTATLDDRNRLTGIHIDGSKLDKNLSTELTFTGYGSVAPITAPADAVAAPDAVYELIG